LERERGVKKRRGGRKITPRPFFNSDSELTLQGGKVEKKKKKGGGNDGSVRDLFLATAVGEKKKERERETTRQAPLSRQDIGEKKKGVRERRGEALRKRNLLLFSLSHPPKKQEKKGSVEGVPNLDAVLILGEEGEKKKSGREKEKKGGDAPPSFSTIVSKGRKYIGREELRAYYETRFLPLGGTGGRGKQS